MKAQSYTKTTAIPIDQETGRARNILRGALPGWWLRLGGRISNIWYRTTKEGYRIFWAGTNRRQSYFGFALLWLALRIDRVKRLP